MAEQLKMYAVELYDSAHTSEYFHIISTNEEDAEAQARAKDCDFRKHCEVNELTSQFKGYDISIVKKAELVKCPVCKTKDLYAEEAWNAISRKDSNLMICDECATEEAFEDELL